MADRYAAFGTVLEFSRDAGTTWKTVAGLTNVETPDGTTDEIDGTAHDSPGGYREFVAGLKDPGSAPIEGFYDPQDASHRGGADGLPGLWASGERVLWRIRHTAMGSGSNDGITFNGYVSAFQATFPANGLMGFTGSIRASGATQFPD